MKSFRKYLLIGGMPQVVNDFSENHNFESADALKRRILQLYHDDVVKFAQGYESQVFLLFDKIPGQLSQKEKKYIISSFTNNDDKLMYNDAFTWLSEAMLVNICLNTTDLNVGLKLSEYFSTQKNYFFDTGLLVTLTFQDDDFLNNTLYRDILLNKIGINEGMLMKNVVAQMLRTHGHRLFFYSIRSSQEYYENIEINFLIRQGRKISPIEVKSSDYKNHTSFDRFNKKFSNKLVLYTKDIMVRDGIIYLPLYMAGLL